MADAMRQWAQRTVAATWPRARIDRFQPLKGDASMRQFWRAELAGGGAPPTAVAVDLGPDDLPLYARALNLIAQPLSEPPVIDVHRLMRGLDVAVPELYAADPAERKLLIEDVGDLSLYAAVKTRPERTAELYRLAIDELVKIHRGRQSPHRGCIAYSIHYDRRLFRWEMDQFVQYGLAEIAPETDGAALGPELEGLARMLGDLPRVLSHRDYHFQNLFIQEIDRAPRIRVIDFQDALMAPAAQDLSVLLTTRDTASFVTPSIEAGLLDCYFDQARGLIGLDRAGFMRSYRWCVLQHALKVIGRFVFLEQTGKSGYAAYLPAALAQARRMLAADDDFPALRRALRPR